MTPVGSRVSFDLKTDDIPYENENLVLGVYLIFLLSRQIVRTLACKSNVDMLEGLFIETFEIIKHKDRLSNRYFFLSNR